MQCMGSVDDNYRCPWCGRVGMGGYSPDWVGYPICDVGPNNCLRQTLIHEICTQSEYISWALQRRYGKHPTFGEFTEELWDHIASFLGESFLGD